MTAKRYLPKPFNIRCFITYKVTTIPISIPKIEATFLAISSGIPKNIEVNATIAPTIKDKINTAGSVLQTIAHQTLKHSTQFTSASFLIIKQPLPFSLVFQDLLDPSAPSTHYDHFVDLTVASRLSLKTQEFQPWFHYLSLQNIHH